MTAFICGGLISVFSCLSLTGAVFAQESVSAAVFGCRSVASCDASGTCVKTAYRAAVLDIDRFGSGSGAYKNEKLFMGPLLGDGGTGSAIGGSFYKVAHQVIYEAADTASITALLSDADLPESDHVWVFPKNGWSGLPKTMFHVRPGREVSGLQGARVATEFICHQGLF